MNILVIKSIISYFIEFWLTPLKRRIQNKSTDKRTYSQDGIQNYQPQPILFLAAISHNTQPIATINYKTYTAHCQAIRKTRLVRSEWTISERTRSYYLWIGRSVQKIHGATYLSVNVRCSPAAVAIHLWSDLAFLLEFKTSCKVHYKRF